MTLFLIEGNVGLMMMTVPNSHTVKEGTVNPFFPTVPTFAVRETASLGIMGAPAVTPLCQETQSLGQQMLERWEKMG